MSLYEELEVKITTTYEDKDFGVRFQEYQGMAVVEEVAEDGAAERVGVWL